MPTMWEFDRSAGSSYEAAQPTRRGYGRKSHHPLRRMPSRNPPPCRDSHTVRLVTGPIVNSNGKHNHGQPFLSMLFTLINVSCIRIVRAIRIPRYVGGCWAIILRTPQLRPRRRKIPGRLRIDPSNLANERRRLQRARLLRSRANGCQK